MCSTSRPSTPTRGPTTSTPSSLGGLRPGSALSRLGAALAVASFLAALAPARVPASSPRTPQLRLWSGAQSAPRAILPRASVGVEYLAAIDLRAFVERHRDGLRDPATAFYVSQALEECAITRDIA